MNDTKEWCDFIKRVNKSKYYIESNNHCNFHTESEQQV